MVIHLRTACPRCDGYGARELNRLPEEGHGVFMCAFCKHTWCEEGRRRQQDSREEGARRRVSAISH